jgi:DNA-directed RNA polymerase subunit RPC12/RpoP
VTIQRTHKQDRGGHNMNRKVRAVCANCNKGFGRAQELARHRKDVHERPRNCPFCGFKWTRPSNIKAHLFAKHSKKFSAENLVAIQALRGRMIVAFLDAYN